MNEVAEQVEDTTMEASPPKGKTRSRGDILGKLIVVALLGFSAFLYLRVIGVIGDPGAGSANRAVPVVAESREPTLAPAGPASEAKQAFQPTMRPVPESQLKIIREVFAPETR